MATKKTGTIQPWIDASGTKRWRARITLADGSRPWLPVPVGYSEARAREFAAAMQEQEDSKGKILAARLERKRKAAALVGIAAVGETANDWFARYLPTIECGESHRRITGHNWTKWIAPLIGPKVMASLTRSDLEDVRDALDRAIDAKTIRHATARNVWSTLTGALKAAYGSRDRTLRIHGAPLHFGVLPPKRGDGRQRPWIYPSESARLIACEAVSVDVRRAYAIALYTGLRPGELRALTWADVDLDARQISVSKSFDEETGSTKAPKTSAGQRTVPIEPALLPLLASLRGDDPGASVVPLLATEDDRMASMLREDLGRAKVTRARLEANNETEEPVDFRSLRDSYATWLALAGIPDKRIQRRLGHKSASTTDRYIKAAEAFDVDAIGAPFPPLPAQLLSTKLSIRNAKAPVSRGFLVARVGFESRGNAETPAFSGVRDTSEASEAHVSPRPVIDQSPVDVPVDSAVDPVEVGLATALAGASAAGRWDVVGQLARELEARRTARSSANVVDLEAARRKGGAR